MALCALESLRDQALAIIDKDSHPSSSVGTSEAEMQTELTDNLSSSGLVSDSSNQTIKPLSNYRLQSIHNNILAGVAVLIHQLELVPWRDRSPRAHVKASAQDSMCRDIQAIMTIFATAAFVELTSQVVSTDNEQLREAGLIFLMEQLSAKQSIIKVNSRYDIL